MKDPISLGVYFLLAGVATVCAFSKEGFELVGTKAPEWELSEWFNSEPLSLKGLRGQVVLVRWWTGPECPYCAIAAPYLKAWYDTYRARGVEVIGIYHHKSSLPLTRRHVEQLVKWYGFQFPVAVDPGWRTLKRWWLTGGDQRWTSVSFLIDQQGIIRYIHPGGSYTKEEAEEMDAIIRDLLRHPQEKEGKP